MGPESLSQPQEPAGCQGDRLQCLGGTLWRPAGAVLTIVNMEQWLLEGSTSPFFLLLCIFKNISHKK